jgi:hypothetical protein
MPLLSLFVEELCQKGSKRFKTFGSLAIARLKVEDGDISGTGGASSDRQMS